MTIGLVRDIGIDLGTANTLVYVRGRGVVVREPSVVAVERATGRILAFGSEAHRMLGRTPGSIVAHRPMRDGVIADYGITQAMLRHYLGRVSGRNLMRPRVMVCIPSGTTPVEKRAVCDATTAAGARRTLLVEEPLAAALGAGLDIHSPRGSCVVDIGGGTTDIAVLSLGGIVLSTSLRVGGGVLDEAIVRHVKRRHGLMIGERTAEEVKIQIGSACPDGGGRGQMEIRGRDLVSGLPRSLQLDARETYIAMSEGLRSVVDGVRAVLERVPPELSSDILESGIVLTGGGAMLHGLDRLLGGATGLPVRVADDPLSCVAVGTGRALEDMDAGLEAGIPAAALG